MCEWCPVTAVSVAPVSRCPSSPKAIAALLQLLARPGELVTRDALLDAVWGHRYVRPATPNRIVTLPRRAFADDATAHGFSTTNHKPLTA